jgi:putative hydrolase of the HAD superfamily
MCIKVIVFDIGNVIFKFDLMKFAKAYALRIPNNKITDFYRLISTYLDFAYLYEKGNISSFDFYDVLAKRTQYTGTYSEFVFQWNNVFKPIPETIGLISKLASAYKLAVLSNINKLHFDYLKEQYPTVFSLFSDFFLSYKMHLRKPENKIYQNLIHHYDIAPFKIFFVDDVKENVEAAKRNGIDSWLFTKTYDLTKKLEEERVLI